jgi:hypothetical protein
MRDTRFWKKHLKNRTISELNSRYDEIVSEIEKIRLRIDRLHALGMESFCWMRYKQYPKEINEELNELQPTKRELEEEMNDIYSFLYIKTDKKHRNDLYC